MPTRKVFRVRAPNGRYALFGGTGAAVILQSYLHWMEGGERPSFAHEKFTWSLLMVDDRRTLYLRHSECDYWDAIGIKQWAMGSGADYALGAMAAGKSAREAVCIASKLDYQTGMGINVVRFPTNRRRA